MRTEFSATFGEVEKSKVSGRAHSETFINKHGGSSMSFSKKCYALEFIEEMKTYAKKEVKERRIK